jgi:hypothetical protein
MADLIESQVLVETLVLPNAGLTESQVLVETLVTTNVPLVASQILVETLVRSRLTPLNLWDGEPGTIPTFEVMR